MAIRSYAQGSYRVARRFSFAMILALPLLSACGGSEPGSEAMSHIERADTYSAQGQYRSAMLEVRNALKAEPDNVAHVVALADLYLTIGAAREATDLLTPWLEQHTEAVALPLARAHVRLGKHLSARETLDAFTPQTPRQQQDAALIRAEAMRLAGDQAGALSAFRSQTESQPGDPEAVVGLARTQMDQNRPSEAVRTTRDWLERNGPEPEVQYWLATAQHRLDQLEQAAATLTDATGNLPGSDVFLPLRREILTLLSRVLTEQGKMADAQVYNNILAENQNSDALAQGEAVVDALRNNDIEQAKSILADMLKANPDNQQAALMLGALNTGTGNLDEGSRLLEKNVDPETTPTAFLRAAAMAQIDTGKREEALQTLDRALQARPNDIELLAMHGVLALSLPDHAQAGLQSLEKALEREPDRTRLRLAMAHYYIANDQPEPALEQMRRTFASQPDDWVSTETYLHLLLEQNETAETEELQQSLSNGYPDSINARYLVAIADAGLGNLDQARSRLEELVRQEPDLPRPKNTLRRLLFAETNVAVAAEDYELARTKARQAIALAPENTGTALLPAAIAQAEGKPDQALREIAAVEQSLGATDGTRLARQAILGSWLEEAGQAMGNGELDKAAKHYQRVLEHQPDNITALNNLAWLLKDTNANEALAMIRQAGELAPNNALVADTHGWILHLTGDHSGAVTVLEKALALAPDNEEIAHHLEQARLAL
ncbi:MAG: tetratricopeptide repeat protein [Alteromonadaceae bacterium]|nr:tetratricopeptide repeat protein [Alteromonadaceae bacterium]